MRIESIGSLLTRPLRQRVLRPHQRVDELGFDGDDDPTTIHFGAFVPVSGLSSAELVGVASLYNRPAPAKWGAACGGVEGERLVSGGAWQLRGMATAPEIRGSGAGGLLLGACLAWAGTHGGNIFWCNARVGVKGFYERYGLVVCGEPYDMPGIGPHVFMWKNLS